MGVEKIKIKTWFVPGDANRDVLLSSRDQTDQWSFISGELDCGREQGWAGRDMSYGLASFGKT